MIISGIGELRKQRDELQAANNRLLEERRALDESQMVAQFHRIFGVRIASRPSLPELHLYESEAYRYSLRSVISVIGEHMEYMPVAGRRRQLRVALLLEEFQEYLEAEQEDDFTAVADALADMIYIIHGTALEYGIPLDEVFREVHRSNMAKVGPDGKAIVREDGKIIKPENWQPPDIARILREKGWSE